MMGLSYHKEGDLMPDYKQMYTKLFQSQTQAISILQEAQRDTEEMYIEQHGLNPAAR